jgi:hypothetical protein
MSSLELTCERALAVAREHLFVLAPKTQRALEAGTASRATLHWIIIRKPRMVRRRDAVLNSGAELPRYLCRADYLQAWEKDQPQPSQSQASQEDSERTVTLDTADSDDESTADSR